MWVFVHVVGRSAAGSGAWRWALGSGRLHFVVLGRLRRVGLRNLELAFPEKTEAERERILRRSIRNLGCLLAEFCLMPGYTAERRAGLFGMRGWRIIWRARDKGKGVLVLTGHLGAWELVELLPLADGDADGDGDSAAG